MTFPVLLASLAFILTRLWTTYYQLNFTSLPPGPRRSFFTGMKPRLSKSEPWKTYAVWGVRFGGAAHCSVSGFTNRLTILLERRAAIYSGRPVSWMFSHAVFNISGLHPRHKIYRRMLQGGLNSQAVKEYWPTLEDEVDILIRGLGETPDQFENHIRRCVAFGYSISDGDDPFISIAKSSSQISGGALEPGRWLVDYFPALRFIPAWVPLAHFKRQGAEWGATLNSMSEVPHKWVKSQMATGNNIPSFTSRLLKPRMTEDEEDIVKWCAGGLYSGASDTTVSATISFIMLMALHPSAQKRAQQEIGSIIGRVPRMVDVHRLPYLLAILKEVMRYAPVANLALPHAATEDDTYAGYRVPAGSTVIANVWAILHDPELYPDPFVFDPERFISPPPSSLPTRPQQLQPDPSAYIWGFGRRRCPGIQFAEPALLLSMASILYNFSIACESSENPVVEFTTGITSHIKPFGLRITPRDVPAGIW
ncbi:cytochrome P450 [Mycena alexandri]|uniref:Cytochrome P450 n=1 Tax=Mycena alexandri TaxID=1745969 RepID=A0AAD6SPX6_9AGAR|nr:cytochrome P450 [Mycena alexandri]